MWCILWYNRLTRPIVTPAYSNGVPKFESQLLCLWSTFWETADDGSNTWLLPLMWETYLVPWPIPCCREHLEGETAGGSCLWHSLSLWITVKRRKSKKKINKGLHCGTVDWVITCNNSKPCDHWFESWLIHFHSTTLLNATGKSGDDNPSTWDPATTLGDSDGVQTPGSGLGWAHILGVN